MALYKRNRTWYIDYYVTVNGKRERRREAVGPRKDLAEARLKECRDMIRDGVDPQAPDEILGGTKTKNPHPSQPLPEATYEEFIPTFMELHGSLVSGNMRRSYNTSFRNLLPVFGNVKLHDISKMMVQSYMMARKRQGRSNGTVNKEINCLKKVLSKALEWEYIERNPLQGLKLLKEEPYKERYLTQEEADRLLDVAPPFLRDIIILALGTAMRQSELFNLRWKDVTFTENGGEIAIIGKGNKLRIIHMNKTVQDLLLRLRKKNNDGSLVFPSTRTGKRYVTVKKAWAKALKDAGIENFRFHDLRHTAASWMVQSGADLYSVQKILGHADIRTTQRYAHLSPQYLRNDICKLDNFLDKSGKNRLAG